MRSWLLLRMRSNGGVCPGVGRIVAVAWMNPLLGSSFQAFAFFLFWEKLNISEVANVQNFVDCPLRGSPVLGVTHT